MSEKRISLGINVSIVVILTIFGVLLSLPLRLLLNTSYYNQNESIAVNATAATQTSDPVNVTAVQPAVIPVDRRKLKHCPWQDYRDRLSSVYQSDYDANCTYAAVRAANESTQRPIERAPDEDKPKSANGTTGRNLTEAGEDSERERRAKSVPVAGHILVTMLLISTIAALVEVLRIRFAKDKDSSKAGSAGTRKASTIELPLQRRLLPRYPMKTQRSFEIQGAKPPPLIRRSSFPTQPSRHSSKSITGTPNNRLSRRQSAESDNEIGILINALHHRTRLIRRH